MASTSMVTDYESTLTSDDVEKIQTNYKTTKIPTSIIKDYEGNSGPDVYSDESADDGEGQNPEFISQEALRDGETQNSQKAGIEANDLFTHSRTKPLYTKV